MHRHELHRHDVFISYNSQDRSAALELDEQLRARGYHPWIDVRDIVLGQRWLDQLESIIERAPAVLVLIGGSGLGPWEAEEMAAALQQAMKREVPVIPVFLKEAPAEVETDSLPLFLQSRVAVDLRTENLDRLITGLGPPAPAGEEQPPSRWNVPRRNPYFTGRDEDLDELHRALTTEGRAALGQAIAGLGGIGKTQTAVEYCHRHRDAYAAVFWVRAETVEEIRTGFADVARSLALPAAEAADQDAIVAAVVRWLEDNDGWLLVFDNADRPDLLTPFLPRQVRGRLLLTSRASEAAFAALGMREPLRIRTLPPAQAKAFLLDRARRPEASGDERQAVAELAEKLGYLPLALEQAAAYVAASGARFRSYLESYAERRLRLLEEAQPQTGDYPATVATTWSLSFQEIATEAPAAADLLRVLAFLAPDAIPLEIFEDGAAELGETLAEALDGDDPLALSRLLEPLLRFSLVERDIEARTVSVHRMVQEAARAGLDERGWAERVVQALDAVYPASYAAYTDIATWPRCDRLEAHVRVVENLIERLLIAVEAAANLLLAAGVYAARRGRLADGKSRIECSLRLREKLHGSEHASVASAHHELARMLRAQGDLEEARKNLERSLEIWAVVHGTQEHQAVAASLAVLASVLLEQGDLEGARENLERSLEIQAVVRGTQEHPDLAASLSLLAIVLRAQGDLEGARKNFEQSLEIQDKVYGTREHYSTAITEWHLGRLRQRLDEPAAGQELLEHAYQVLLSQLGPEHPHTRKLGAELGKGDPS